MRLPVCKKTNMMVPTHGERLTANPAVVFALFFPVLLVTQWGRSAVYGLVASLLPAGAPAFCHLLIQLFATVVTVAAVLLYCLLGERRSLSTLGFRKKGLLSEYVIGLLGGLALFGGAVLLCVACGVLTVSPAETPPAPGISVLFLLGFLIQGMSEEMLCRSYLMVSLSRGFPLWLCVVLNALLFSVLHIGNPGVTAVALINIFLFGLFASMLTLRRGSIWMVGALHSMWNFAQGNLFGIPVSGLTGSPSPFLSVLKEGRAAELLHGGDFGLEGGLAVTVVMTAACAAALLMPTKRSEIAASADV